MRQVDSATLTALQRAAEDGIAPRDYVWIEASGGQAFGFYSDIEPAIEQIVIDGRTGLPVQRPFYGAGALHSISDIKLVTGLTIRRVTVKLSNIHQAVNNMVRGYDVRNRYIQINRGLVNMKTGQLVSTPGIHFIGKVDTATPTRPAVDGEGGISLDCISYTDELTRVNPARISDAHQRIRQNDALLKYADIMQEVKVVWGEG